MKYILSNYNYDPSWVKEYTDQYLVYDRSDADWYIHGFDSAHVIKVSNIGSDIYDKFNYIIDNYDNLPEVAVYAKSNLFKYITRPEWDLICHNQEFTPILTKNHPLSNIDLEGQRRTVVDMIENSEADEETKRIWYKFNQVLPDKRASVKRFCYYENGVYYELNLLHYVQLHQGSVVEEVRQIKEIQDLLGIADLEYVPFAPGSSYILPKANILKQPKELYIKLNEYLKEASRENPYPRAAMLVERGLYTLWS